MPAPIVVNSVFASWPVMCAVFAAAAVVVVVLAVAIALVTGDSHRAGRRDRSLSQPPADEPADGEHATDREHVLV